MFIENECFTLIQQFILKVKSKYTCMLKYINRMSYEQSKIAHHHKNNMISNHALNMPLTNEIAYMSCGSLN